MHIVSELSLNFQEILCSSLIQWSCADKLFSTCTCALFNKCKIKPKKFKRVKIQNEKSLVICISTHCVFIISLRNSVQRIRRSCADKLFSTKFIFNSSFTWSKVPRKMMELELSCNMYIYTYCELFFLRQAVKLFIRIK